VNSKQIVAVAGICALLAIIVYPALSTGSVSIVIRSSRTEKADHIYVLVSDVRAHRVGQVSTEGWDLISNQSQTIDLMTLTDSSITLAKGQLPVAKFDMVRVGLSNVTWVYNKTSTRLQVDSSTTPVNIEFTVAAGKESAITLILTGHEEDLQGTKFFRPQLSATATLHP
jgi:hypothetical protein